MCRTVYWLNYGYKQEIEKQKATKGEGGDREEKYESLVVAKGWHHYVAFPVSIFKCFQPNCGCETRFEIKKKKSNGKWMRKLQSGIHNLFFRVANADLWPLEGD